MRAAWLIALKDLKERVRDRSAIVLGIVAPFALALVFNSLFGAAGTFSPDYGIVDEDGGPLAAVFVEQVLPSLEDFATLTTLANRNEALTQVEEGQLSAVFVVPAGFSAAVQAGSPAEIEVIGNVDAEISTQIARSVSEAYAGELTAVQLSVAGVLATDPSADPVTLAARAAQQANPIAVTEVGADVRQLDATTYLSAGMAVFFLFFVVSFGVIGLLDERHNGTLSRLLAAPIRRPAIVVGKALTSFILGLISMSVLIIATSLLLGASWGDPIAVALLVLAVALAATGIVALVASVARTPEQAGNMQAIVAIVLGMLGGTFFPLSQAPGLVGSLSRFTPHAWFLQGLGDLASGGGVADIVPALGAILAFAAAAWALASFRIGRAVRP